jgi:hypothetical protein
MSIWISDGTLFLNVVSIFKFILLFYQWYIANMIGAACNSRIPQANLHVELKSWSVCFFYIHMSYRLPLATASKDI